MRRVLLSALGAVLLTAVALVIYGETRPLKRTFYGSVKDLLPTEAELPGWKVEYLPIAETEEARARVAEVLGYDDVIYVTLKKDAIAVDIFVAYWAPGKVLYRDVAGHTPDNCWINSGWALESKIALDKRATFSRVFRHTESRTFTLNGTRMFVFFWHWVGGKVEYFEDGWPPKWHSALQDLWRVGRRMRAEQLFIRVGSTTLPYNDAAHPAFVLVAEKLIRFSDVVDTDAEQDSSQERHPCGDEMIR